MNVVKINYPDREPGEPTTKFPDPDAEYADPVEAHQSALKAMLDRRRVVGRRHREPSPTVVRLRETALRMNPDADSSCIRDGGDGSVIISLYLRGVVWQELIHMAGFVITRHEPQPIADQNKVWLAHPYDGAA